MTTLIETFVDAFIRSDYVTNWQAEAVEASGYSGNTDRRDRFTRCHDAAEDGADGSTHRENINDWREAFRSLMRSRRHPVERFADAVEAHFDSVEQWHIDTGSIDTEIG